MPLAQFIEGFPALDLPFPESKVETRAMRTEHGLAVFFKIKEDVELPPHAHGAQWGTVIEGQVELTIDGRATVYGPGDTYDIPAGTVHAVRVPGGSLLLDVFEEPDRYPLKD
ncbi:MAG: cupin domain-containing protein [Pseudomonadota bacterium]